MLRSGTIRSARNRVTVLTGGTALAVTTALLLHSPSSPAAAAPTDLAGVMATVAQESATATDSADFYLKVDGIDGESMVKGHEKQIEIESFSWGVTNTPTSGAAGSGARVGKPKFNDFSVAKLLDKASPLLMQAVASGQHIKSVTLFGVTRGEGGGQDFMTITLSDVLVSSYQSSGAGGGGGPQDSLSLNFTKITFDFKPQNPDGSLGSAVHGGWDLKANKKA